jgi:hypothetical protein
MRQSSRSVAAGILLSVSVFSLMVLAGCGGTDTGPVVISPGIPAGAKNVYAVVSNYPQDQILTYSATATGTTTPSSTLDTPPTFVIHSIAIGPQGQIYVLGRMNPNIATYDTILEYAAGASGSATPTVTLNGSIAGTSTFTYAFYIAVNSANTLVVSSVDGTIESFASGFTSSSAPTQYLTWGKTNNLDPGDEIGVDTAGDIFIVDTGNTFTSKATFLVFAAGATGSSAPTRSITGTDTTSFYYNGFPLIAVDGAGDLFVAYYNATDDPNVSGATPLANNEATGIIEFGAGATGNATPLKRISGALTKIVEPQGLALDVAGNVYYVDALGGDVSGGTTPLLLEVFSSTATGNVAPTGSITTTGYTYDLSEGIAAF